MRGAPGLRYVFSPSQHAKERREMLLIMTEGGVLVCPSRGQFETVPNATFLIFAKGRLYGTHWCEKCRERDTSRKGHCYGTGPWCMVNPYFGNTLLYFENTHFNFASYFMFWLPLQMLAFLQSSTLTRELWFLMMSWSNSSQESFTKCQAVGYWMVGIFFSLNSFQ